MPLRSRRPRRKPTKTTKRHRARKGSTKRHPRLEAAGVVTVAALVLTPSAHAWWGVHGVAVVSTARWAVPLACSTAIAVISSVAILRRRHAVTTSTTRRLPVAVPGLRNDGKDLERRFAAVLRRDGYLNVLDPDAPPQDGLVVGRGKDRGLDGGGWHPDYGLVVGQCKQYSSNVGAKDMAEFLGRCWYVIEVRGRKPDVALFVTTAGFTPEALHAAHTPQLVRGYERAVTTIDGAAFARWEAGTWHPLPLPTRQEVI